MRLTPILALALILAPAATWAADSGDHDGRNAERREKLLAKFDTNHDGKLDESERAAAKAAMQQHRAEREAKLKANHPELFAKIDTNGDGKLERDEIKAWRAAHPGRHHRDDKKS